jgi:tetratricopeptide (TPR) repeat protein
MFALAFREAYLGVGKMTFERNRPGSTSLGKRLMWQSLKDLTGALPSATPGFRFGKVSAAPLVHEFSIEQLGASAKLLYGQAGKPYLETEQLKDAIAGYNKSLEFMRPSNPRYNDLISQRASAEAQLAAAQGDYNEALKKFASGKVGQRFLERYPDAAPLIHDYFQAGGKPHMDERFRLRATENFRTAYKNAVADHRELAAAGNALLAINEAMLAPLFETFIPNLKLGIFLKEYSFAKVENERKLERVENLRKGIDRIQYEIAQLNDERRRTPASHPPGVPVDPARMAKIQGIEDRLRAKTEQLNKTQVEHDAMQAQRGYSLKQIARETNDFVEDRFGEMNFDNLFWNNTIKTCLQLSFRSVTWKLGNARATGKGVRGGWRTMRDFYKALPGLASGTGEAPALEAHFSWLFTTMMLAVTVSAILSKMMGHQSFKDTFRKLAEGDWTEAVYFHSDEVGGRNSFPSYARDWVHLARSPGGYVTSSYAGDIGRFMDLLRNKDFYGTEVYHPGDEKLWKVVPYKQAWDAAKHMVPMPFAWQSFAKSREQGQPLSSQALGLLGFTKAPTDITDSPAVRTAKEAAAATVSVGARTKEEFEKSQHKHQLMNKLKRGEDVYDEGMALVGQGKLTVKDLEDVVKQYQTPPLTRAIQRITDPDKLLEVWEKATNEEKAEIQSLLLNRLGSVVRNRPGQWTPRIEQRVAKDEVETWRPPQQIRTAPPPGVEGY